MRSLRSLGSLVLASLSWLGSVAPAAAQGAACEHRGATSVFELALSSPILATAAVARPSGGPATLIVLECHRGVALGGARVELDHDDPALVDGERVLVFARRVDAELRAAAGPRALLRGAELSLAPELALFPELPSEEREELAIALARRSPRCAADRATALTRTSLLHAAPRAEPRSDQRPSFLRALRTHRSRQG
ncbi:MAG: hypothetical protein JNM84_23185 [Planctomycetes bacterium]|nr:hypothetical protein [Planctomycetota bacterium]